MNARYCGASLTECTCRTWSSYSIFTLIRMWLNLRSQNITKNLYTCTQELYTQEMMYKACCTQAGPAHAAGCGDGMGRWQHSSHLFCMCYRYRLYCAVVLKRCDTGSVSQAAKTNSIDRLPCGYLYCSSHWSPWMVSILVVATEEIDCPWFMSSTLESFLN